MVYERDDAQRGSLSEVHGHAQFRRRAIWTLADRAGRGVRGGRPYRKCNVDVALMKDA